MTIEAICTIQILAGIEHSDDLEALLLQSITELKKTPGCLGYHAFKPEQCERSWVIASYWKEALAMHEHFHSVPLTELLSKLCSYSTNMDFRCFPEISVTDGTLRS